MTKGHSFGGLAAIIYRLKERRLARNLTQQYVADLIDRPQSSISEWETGETVPSMGSLADWAEALEGEIVVELRWKT